MYGPDGKLFFRIDAPHGAPAQHFLECDEAAMLVALLQSPPFSPMCC